MAFLVEPAYNTFTPAEYIDGDIKDFDCPEIREAAKARGRNVLLDTTVLWGGYRIVPRNFPTKMRLTEPRKELKDFWNGPSNRVVSERLHAIIEELEPSAHQFFPMEAYTKNGALLDRCYGLIICNRIDAIDDEHSQLDRIMGNGELMFYNLYRPKGFGSPGERAYRPDQKMLLRRDKIGACHIWVDPHYSNGPFVSQELGLRMKEIKATGVKLVEVKEL
jgi:hypothetical protein